MRVEIKRGVLTNLGDCSHFARRNGTACGHRLQWRNAKPFRQRWVYEKGRPCISLAQHLVCHHRDAMQEGRKTERGNFRLLIVRERAAAESEHVVLLIQPALVEGLQQRGKVLMGSTGAYVE